MLLLREFFLPIFIAFLGLCLLFFCAYLYGVAEWYSRREIE